MIELPLPVIDWTLVRKMATKIINRLKIDVIFEKKENNPFITVAFNVARVRYTLALSTHGWPKFQPDVIFTQIKGLGDVVKSAVSPSGIGEVDGSFRLKLYKDDLPVKSEISLNVDFEIKIETDGLLSLTFSGHSKILNESNPVIEVLVTNNCDFPLEQIYVTVNKTTSLQATNTHVYILDKSSHQITRELEQIAIKKGDDHLKWVTSFEPHESLLFKVKAR